MGSEKPKLEVLQDDFQRISKLPRLSAAVDNVDRIIQLLTAARNQIAESEPPNTPSIVIKLQNPVKTAFDSVNDGLKGVAGAHKKMGKALDKSFPVKALPMDHDAMSGQVPLINRAIAMHLLREGQFSVASTFIDEVQASRPRDTTAEVDEAMDEDDGDGEGENSENADEDEELDDADDATSSASSSENYDLSSLHSQELRVNFADMYTILQQLKAKNLAPAISWARTNSVELEARGSNLEFELTKLQYVWLFKGPSVNGLPDNEHNGRIGALKYARENFGRFSPRYQSDISELAAAMAYAPNLSGSPYRKTFVTATAFNDVASSFTREFCSLLGLSAESPLYLAATAGALALPQLIKYTQKVRSKGTEWTTANELAFETPLPESMLYHSIFVCPVSKDQTTDANPPMMIPCGHVLAKETLTKLCKGSRFKCPYCPSEGLIKDARQIILQGTGVLPLDEQTSLELEHPLERRWETHYTQEGVRQYEIANGTGNEVQRNNSWGGVTGQHPPGPEYEVVGYRNGIEQLGADESGDAGRDAQEDITAADTLRSSPQPDSDFLEPGGERWTRVVVDIPRSQSSRENDDVGSREIRPLVVYSRTHVGQPAWRTLSPGELWQQENEEGWWLNDE